MKKSERAAELYKGGFNCAAAVLAEFCEEYDLDLDLAFKLTNGMGGGFLEGDICGALSAAILVVGLKYGHSVKGDHGANLNCYAKTRQLIDAFKKEHGAITCRRLLAGKDDSEEERRRMCTGFIKSAVDILE